jgi:hypothetical protein
MNWSMFLDMALGATALAVTRQIREAVVELKNVAVRHEGALTNLDTRVTNLEGGPGAPMYLRTPIQGFRGKGRI